MKRFLALVLVLMLCAVAPSCALAEGAAKVGGEVTILRESAQESGGLYMLLEQIEAETGLKVNMVWSDSSSSADTVVLMISSGETLDLASTSGSTYYNYLNNGLLQPIDNVLTENGPSILERVNPNLWTWCKGDDGLTYAVPAEQLNYVTAVAIRKDWLEEQNLANPTTVEEYENMLRVFKDAYDCSPLMLRLDASGRHFEPFLCGAFLENGWSWWKSEDGTYLPPEMAPGYKDMIETLTRWYADGLISPDSFQLRANVKTLIEANKVGAVMDSFGVAQSNSLSAVDVVEGLDWIELPALSGKYDNGNYAVSNPASYKVVPIVAENPAGAIKILDWIASDLENTISSVQGVKGFHWDWSDPDGEVPSDWVNAQNFVVDHGVTGDDAFVRGAFELLDINNFLGRGYYEETSMMANLYRWYEKCYAWEYDYYTTLDDQMNINESALSCSTEIVDCKTALNEKVVAIITGADSIDTWEGWLEGEYMAIGMEEVIRVKNEIYVEGEK